MTLSPASAQALVARQAEGWGNADPDQIVADFATDCQFIAPGQHLLGRSQVYQAATEFFAANNRVEITVQRVISQENAVAVEWQWHETNLQTGQQQQADDAIIIQLNNQQQIVYWREYIDRRSA
ncbi:nuclear transport factor 2 family protein [Sphaerothrix gracilis]|uniref:nuclear transport factor 2 family protein n=1 Tax=Sphaerothrix gracilis TaxID=3151835 RepID=UPI0031FCCEE4